MLCGEITLAGDGGGQGFAATLHCRRWECEECELINKRRWASIIRELHPTHFVTVTVNPRWRGSPDEKAGRLSGDWSTSRRWMRQKIKTRFGIEAKLDFVAGFEAHISGEPHLHIAVADCHVYADNLQSLLLEWMGEPRRSRRVTVLPFDKRAAYMTKAPVLFNGRRRFWTSRGWRSSKPLADVVFTERTIVPAPLDEIKNMVRSAGLTIHTDTPSRITFDAP